MGSRDAAEGGGGGGGGGGGEGECPTYPQGIYLRPYRVWRSVQAASGGFLVGFSFAIPAMELRPIVDSLQPFFPSVYRKEKFDHSTHLSCNFQSRVLTLFSSFFYIAAIFAFLLASPFTKRYGRANTIFAGGIFGLIGAALGMATNLHMSMMIWGRVLLGIGVGFINQSVPLYLLEMVPYYNHDQCNMLYYYYHISCGICASYFSAGGREGSILGCQAIAPAVCTIVYCCRLSDTPSSLVNRGKMDEAKTELRLIHGVKNVDIQFWDILFATKASKKVLDSEWSKLLRKQYRPQLVMSILIPCFQQFTGISAMLFCAPMLFEALGFGSLTSLMLGLSISILNVRAGIFTMNRNRIDNWGRRQLFIAGGIVIFVFQIAVACLIGKQFGIAESGNSGEVVTNFSQGYAMSFVLCICILVVAFALSWGPLEWLILTEIFPLEIRSAAQSVSVAVNMISTFLMSQILLKMLCAMKFWLFMFLAVFALVMTSFVAAFLPETNNISIEDMSQIWRKHWFWRRYFYNCNIGVGEDLEASLLPLTRTLSVT